MANYNDLKTAIQQVIKTNGNNEITGALLQQSLLSMINSLGAGYQFMGIATPETNPGTPDQNVFYVASIVGTYPNFGDIVISYGEIAIMKYNGVWSKDSTGCASLEIVNQLGQKLSKYTGNYEFQDSVTGGILFNVEHPVSIKANAEFDVLMIDNGVLSGGELNATFYNLDKTKSKYVLLVTNVAQRIKCNFDVASIRLNRISTGVISSGNIETNIVLSKDGLSIDNVEDIFGNRSFAFSDEIQSGVAFNAKHDIPLRKNNVIFISSPSDGQFADNEINFSGFNKDSDSAIFKTIINLTKFSKIVVPENVDYFSLNRYASGVISTGTLSTNISIVGLVDTHINDNVNGKTSIARFSATSGVIVDKYIPVEIPANKTASIVIETSNSIFRDDEINFMLYDGEKIVGKSTIKNIKVPFIITPKERITKLRIVRSAAGIIGSGTVRIVVSIWGDVGNDVAYMATNGDDINDGTFANPVSSLVRALAISRNVIVRGGEYSGQELDLSAFSGKDICISSYQGEKPIFTKSVNIANGNEVQYSGNVFSVDCADSPTANWLWQHLIADANTAIGVDEIHPLQKGIYNRLDCTKIQKILDASVVSLSDAVSYMENAFLQGKYFWYYQSGKLYFTRPTATSNIHPIVMPNGSIIFGENSGNKLHLSGLNFYYGNVSIVNSLKTEINDCVSKYNNTLGSFYWLGGKDLVFKKCEAAATCNGVDYGDGFNGGTTQPAPDIVCASVCLIDCWSHDNNDDGYSDHHGCECIIRGGLYEYNQKAGVTPSYGTHCCCYDVISRKNINGFYYIGRAADYGKSGNALFFNCIANDNSNDGFKVDGIKEDIANTVICKSCASINNANYGYEGKIYAYDCGALENANAKDANVVVKNTQIL